MVRLVVVLRRFTIWLPVSDYSCRELELELQRSKVEIFHTSHFEIESMSGLVITVPAKLLRREDRRGQLAGQALSCSVAGLLASRALRSLFDRLRRKLCCSLSRRRSTAVSFALVNLYSSDNENRLVSLQTKLFA